MQNQARAAARSSANRGLRAVHRPARLVTCAVVALLAAVPPLAASELAFAIQDGERRAALALIEQGADVNEAQGDGTTPLHWAVYRVDAELTSLLLERGARPSAVNAYGSSPLAEAVKVGNFELVEMLLDAGADVEAANTDGQTALMLSARSGSIEIARLLIERGANVNAKEAWRGQTALVWAADARFPELVDLLLAHGAEVELRALATDWPAQITSEPRAQYRPVGGLTPLLYAARSGCAACVRAIVAAGAEIDRPTPEGMTPLMIALDNGSFDTAKLLLELGANPHLWDWYGRTALYIAVDMNGGGGRRGGAGGGSEVTALEIIEQLLEAGVDPDAQLNMHRPSRGGNIGRFSDNLLTTGCTPLLRAVVAQDLRAIRLLLEHGADAGLPNAAGVTPLIAAAGIGNGRGGFGGGFGGEDRAIEMIEVLLAAGANVNARLVERYGYTAKIGREPNSLTEREGHSALFAAVSRGWADTVRLLIERGAEVDIVDTRGRSPLDVAMGQIEEDDDDTAPAEIAELLRSYLDGA